MYAYLEQGHRTLAVILEEGGPVVLQILKSESFTGFPYGLIQYTLSYFTAVLGIRHVLVRVRILGSVTLTIGPGCGSGRAKKIRILWIRIRMRIRNTGTFTSFFKFKKIIMKIKNCRNQGFIYFCLMMEGSGAGSVLVTNGSGSPTLLYRISLYSTLIHTVR